MQFGIRKTQMKAPQPRSHGLALPAVLPELSSNREGLIAEVPVYGRLASDAERLVAGRADAVRVAWRPHIVFDWKSDIDPAAASRADYANQLSAARSHSAALLSIRTPAGKRRKARGERTGICETPTEKMNRACNPL